MNGVAARKRGRVSYEPLDGHVLIMGKVPLEMASGRRARISVGGIQREAHRRAMPLSCLRRTPGIAELSIATQKSGAACERTLLRLGLGSYMF